MRKMTDYDKRVIEEAKSNFRRIMEYTDMAGSLTEDGPDDEQGAPQDPNAMGGGPNDMGADPNAMGGGPNAMGGGPNDMGGDPNAMGGGPNDMPADPTSIGSDPNAMGGGPNAMGDNPSTQQNGAPGFNPQGGGEEDSLGEEPSDDESEDGDDIDSDDEVLDIDDLTDYQQKTVKGVGKISSEIKDLKNLISKFQDAVDSNNQGIQDLKREIQKRNPDAQEKMNLRQSKSGPFTQSIEGYWENDAPDNYSVENDNNGQGDQRYEITQADIDDVTDMRGISKSMDAGSFGSLKDIFNDY